MDWVPARWANILYLGAIFWGSVFKLFDINKNVQMIVKDNDVLAL